MTIDKLGGIEPLKNVHTTHNQRQTQRVANVDTISVSPEAQKKAEIYLAMQSVHASPDIRYDKIAEVEKKLADPNYINSVLDGVADKIIEAFDL